MLLCQIEHPLKGIVHYNKIKTSKMININIQYDASATEIDLRVSPVWSEVHLEVWSPLSSLLILLSSIEVVFISSSLPLPYHRIMSGGRSCWAHHIRGGISVSIKCLKRLSRFAGDFGYDTLIVVRSVTYLLIKSCDERLTLA